jgi:hypothetical protein
VIANKEWFSLYLRVEVLKELQLHSNHCFMSIFPMNMLYGKRQNAGFRYEVGWNDEKECQDIKRIWRVKETPLGSWQSISRRLEKRKQQVLK